MRIEGKRKSGLASVEMLVGLALIALFGGTVWVSGLRAALAAKAWEQVSAGLEESGGDLGDMSVLVEHPLILPTRMRSFEAIMERKQTSWPVFPEGWAKLGELE